MPLPPASLVLPIHMMSARKRSPATLRLSRIARPRPGFGRQGSEESIDAKSIHRRDRDGGSDIVDRQRRAIPATSPATGPSGTHFGSSQLERNLAGVEHRLLESGRSFGRRTRRILESRSDRRDSGGAERRAWRHDSVLAGTARKAERKPRQVARGRP